ncbi:hypothetical protein ZWY2020_059664 [Hordeum vulgare]|nr:hypothetical protein ZWY2020_059664 [Hordeum vulgare]
MLLAALCAVTLAPAVSGQPTDALTACIDRCGCVPCPTGKVCITVCTPPPPCAARTIPSPLLLPFHLMAAPALKFAAVVLLVFLCAAALAPAASGQPTDGGLAACIRRCGCVPCPKGRFCPAVCRPPPDCAARCV